jgi:hypothetical protein
MQQQLTEYRDLLAAYHQPRYLRGPYRSAEVRADLVRRGATATEILKRIGPQFSHVNLVEPSRKSRSSATLNLVNRALAILAYYDERAKRPEPDAKGLPPGQFHPWIWDAASTLWASGHRRLAVQAAATAVNAHTQAKLGRRDVADTQLMQESFSPNPPEAGKPRLRCPGDPGNPTTQSRQRGALQYALGCFGAIRNPATHEQAEWDQQVALECLAALSVLARWIDGWTLDKAP